MPVEETHIPRGDNDAKSRVVVDILHFEMGLPVMTPFFGAFQIGAAAGDDGVLQFRFGERHDHFADISVNVEHPQFVGLEGSRRPSAVL